MTTSSRTNHARRVVTTGSCCRAVASRCERSPRAWKVCCRLAMELHSVPTTRARTVLAALRADPRLGGAQRRDRRFLVGGEVLVERRRVEARYPAVTDRRHGSAPTATAASRQAGPARLSPCRRWENAGSGSARWIVLETVITRKSRKNRAGTSISGRAEAHPPRSVDASARRARPLRSPAASLSGVFRHRKRPPLGRANR